MTRTVKNYKLLGKQCGNMRDYGVEGKPVKNKINSQMSDEIIRHYHYKYPSVHRTFKSVLIRLLVKLLNPFSLSLFFRCNSFLKTCFVKGHNSLLAD